jgi:quercetin dioxygenase-like cupin family protein
MDNPKIDFTTIPWETPLPGARYKAFQKGGRRVRLVEFTKEFVEPDWCSKGHIGYVLEGILEVDFDGRVIQLSEGDGVFIPAEKETRHKASTVTDIVRLILIEDAEHEDSDRPR